MSNKEELYEEYYFSDTDFDKKYTLTHGANVKTAEKVVETENGNKIETTYTDKNGYTFSIRQKKANGKITYIAVNKPNGDQSTEVRISSSILKNVDELPASKRNKIMKQLPSDVIENGASLAEVYSNYSAYMHQSVPYDERPKGTAQKNLQASQSYSDDDFFYFDIDEYNEAFRNMQIEKIMHDKELEKQKAALAKQTPPQNIEKTKKTNENTDVQTQDPNMELFIKAKANTL